MDQKIADKLIASIFLLNDEEEDAVLGYIPMTQELFDSILDKIMGRHVDAFFYEMLAKYPEFLKDSEL